jgi:dihydrofolate reductase
MAKVEANISMSLDGFVTGPNLDRYPGLGEGGDVLHAWIHESRAMDFAMGEERQIAGSVITSQKVYDLTGGWGDDGFYRMPVFVVTHRPHDVVVKDKTAFTFVTEGVERAIEQAIVAAGDKLVHIMGGASVIQQALAAGMVPARRPGGPDQRYPAVRAPRRSDPAGAGRGDRVPRRHSPAVPDREVAPSCGHRSARTPAEWDRCRADAGARSSCRGR